MHTVWHTGHVSMVLSGWGTKNQRSVPPSGPSSSREGILFKIYQNCTAHPDSCSQCSCNFIFGLVVFWLNASFVNELTPAQKASDRCCRFTLMKHFSNQYLQARQYLHSKVTSRPTCSQFPVQSLTTNIYGWSTLNLVCHPCSDSCHVTAPNKLSRR